MPRLLIAASGTGLFLTGVAYDDGGLDDDFYTPGEGLGGVTVTATRTSDQSVFETTTWATGGYTLRLPAGTYTVVAAGGGLPRPVTHAGVSISTRNVKRDFLPVPDQPPTLTTVATLAGASRDTPFTITYDALAAAADEADPEGGPVHFRIRAVSSGTLLQGGTAVTPGTTLLSPGGSLTWIPAAGATGTLAAFTVDAWDGALASSAEVPVRVQVAAGNGAIYQSGQDVRLFENTVARRVGDTLTIRLVENMDASKSSSTSTKKGTSVEMSGPTIAGRPVTVNGIEVLSAGVDNASSFDGEGSSRQSNSIFGDITVTVAKRWPNGNLFVRGEKWITINQGREFVRVSGIVRAVDIEPDNTVPSTKIADARITYAGRGAIADANAPGLLSRFFNAPWLPF